jgi:hypothetical protein
LGYIRTYRHLVKYESDFSIAQDKKALLQCRSITQRNWSQKDSTSNEMHAIDCIAIHSVDYDDDECQTKEYSSA